MNEMHPSIDRIVDYLHGELSAADDAAVHAHLAGCPECDERRAQEVALTEMLRAHARATERDLPPRIISGIREAVRRRPPGLWEQLRIGLRPSVALPAAAAIALTLYAGLTFSRHSVAPTAIDAATYVDQHASLSRFAPFGEDQPPATLTSDDNAR
jgi:anti-sigma factor RsiW